jgi:GT2 family glycosyltransferase
VITYDKPFNHSDMHNKAIAEIDSELIVLMNNDVYGFNRGWLEQLVATIENDESIAGVGAKLFYPDGTIQHAGVVIGSCGGLAGHADCKHPGNTPGYYGRSRALHQVSGVTAALMIMRKSAFEAVGGFDAARYPTSFNDVNLWVRLGDAGYRCLFNPGVHAIHEEGKTRTMPPDEGEFQRRLYEDLRRREWRDPYWNLALFGNLEELFEHERTWDWIPEKVKMLRKEIQKLKTPPAATTLENLAELLSKSIPDGAYTARISREDADETEPWSSTPGSSAQPSIPDLRRELPVSAPQVFHQA